MIQLDIYWWFSTLGFKKGKMMVIKLKYCTLLNGWPMGYRLQSITPGFANLYLFYNGVLIFSVLILTKRCRNMTQHLNHPTESNFYFYGNFQKFTSPFLSKKNLLILFLIAQRILKNLLNIIFLQNLIVMHHLTDFPCTSQRGNHIGLKAKFVFISEPWQRCRNKLNFQHTILLINYSM